MRTMTKLSAMAWIGLLLAACDATQDLGGGTTEGGEGGEGGRENVGPGSGAGAPTSSVTSGTSGGVTQGSSSASGEPASTAETSTGGGEGGGGAGGAGTGGEGTGGSVPICEGPDGLPAADVLLEADEGARAIAVDGEHVVISTRSTGASFWDVNRFRKADGMPRGFFAQMHQAPWALGLDDGEVFEGGYAEAESDENLFGTSPVRLPLNAPEPEPLHTYSPNSLVQALAFTATDVVFVEADRVWKAPKNPGALAAPTRLASIAPDEQADGMFEAVAVDATYAFVANAGWFTGPGGIVRVRLDGTEVTTIASTPDYSDPVGQSFCIGPESLVLDGDDVIYNDACAGQILRVSKDGGEPELIADSPGAGLVQLTMVGDDIYFSQLAEGCGTIVKRVAKSGGAVTDVAFVDRYVGRAVSDGDDVYLVPAGIDEPGPFRLYRVLGD